MFAQKAEKLSHAFAIGKLKLHGKLGYFYSYLRKRKLFPNSKCYGAPFNST
jgi:hypothetical protein